MLLDSFINSVKKTSRILWSPKESFRGLEDEKLEGVVAFYFRMLVIVSVVSGLFFFVFSFIKAIYLDIFLRTDINYWRMINYLSGRSASLVFLYLFIGTFIVFLISLVLFIFFRKIKYLEVLKGLLYSLTPFLLFGWLFMSLYPLIIWSVFLFINWVSVYRVKSVDKSSIHFRD